MSKYYGEKIKPSFDSRVLLFQIAKDKAATRSWYFRYRLKTGKYYQCSLKTADRSIALDKAKTLWLKILQKDEQGLLYTKKTFLHLFSDFMEAKDYSNSREHRYKRIKSFYSFILCRDDCPISQMQIGKIKDEHWLKFLKWRCELFANSTEEEIRSKGTVRTPSIKTLNHDRSLLLQSLRWASRKGFIKVMPEFSEIETSVADRLNIKISFQKVRGGIPTKPQWQSIMQKLYYWSHWDVVSAYRWHNKRFPEKPFKYHTQISKDYVDQFLRDNHEELSSNGTFTPKDAKTGEITDSRSTNSSKRFARRRLYYALRMSMATLLRPTNELGSCKWSQYEPLKSPKYPDITLALLETHQAKRSNNKMDPSRKRLAVGNYHSDLLFQTWRRICKEYGYGSDDDYIFPKWTTDKEKRSDDVKIKHQQMSFSEMGRTFSLLLKKWDLHKTPSGETITMYSSRHRAISDRINSGQNLLTIATAAGTSMQEISRTYARVYARYEADLLANTFGDLPPEFNDRYKARLATELLLSKEAPQITYMSEDQYS